jgi:uncharacterized phiE125 gp8 family phage protein
MTPLHPLRLSVAALDQSPLPLDITLVKEHLAVTSNDTDSIIETFIRASILWAEGSMRRTIYARQHEWVLNDFPYEGDYRIDLPRGKTQSVESIVYYQNGSAITLNGPSSSASPTQNDYQEDLTGDDGGVLMPVRGSGWPTVDTDVPAPVKITFNAGWLAAEVPQDVEHALLFSCSDAYDLRGSGDFTVFGRNFETRELLISPYKIHRWY